MPKNIFLKIINFNNKFNELATTTGISDECTHDHCSLATDASIIAVFPSANKKVENKIQ